MAIGSNSDRLMSDINVTPFVDVMLVLLIIFMVTAPMMVQGVDVSLPEAASQALPAEQEQLVITINKENQVFINDHQVRFDLLQEKLTKILENRSDRTVYFRADRDISWGMGVRVMSEIKGAGIEKLGIVTEPADLDKKEKAES
ncbi:biopolymer transporter ExbD [Desulfobacterales bacterium HSG2]|nr:biopolymer transporter ExbD [Desulfobacterales bacterium HSG2]